MNYNYITYIPLETCIGNSLETFNTNFTSLDLNIKQLSSSVESRTSYLSSILPSVSSVLDNRIQYLSTQIPVISSGIEEQLNFASIISSVPNNVVPVVLYSKNINYENIDSGIVAKGNGATLLQKPNNDVEGGKKRGKYVTDFQKTRDEAQDVSSGDYSVLFNGHSNSVLSMYSSLMEGYHNSVSGLSSYYSFIGSGQDNIISSDHSSIVCGSINSLLSSYNVCAGTNNQLNKLFSFSVGDNNVNSFAPSAQTGFGNTEQSNASATCIIGSYGRTYYDGHNVYSNSSYVSAGDSQLSVLILRETTSSGEHKNLSLYPIPQGQLANFIPPENNQIWYGKLKISAVNRLGQSAYFYEILAAKRDSSGGLSLWPSSSSPSFSYNPYGVGVLLSIAAGALLQITITSPSTETWYWTGIFEFIDLLY